MKHKDVNLDMEVHLGCILPPHYPCFRRELEPLCRCTCLRCRVNSFCCVLNQYKVSLMIMLGKGVSLRHCRISEFIVSWYCCTRCSWILCRYLINLKIFSILLEFYYKQKLARRPTPKPEDYRRSAVGDCLFNLLPATLHMWRPPSRFATWRRARPWWLPWADIHLRYLNL